VSIEKTEKLTSYQKSIAKNVSEHTTDGNWKDYKWQLHHSIKDITTFEKLTGIVFTEKEHEELERTVSKFPMSITPYYAS
jgi:lysine 2,3-aminomutase